MTNKDPLDRLSNYYQSLDSIPTPPLQVKPKRPWGIWALGLVPLGASLAAYAFMAFCASSPADPSAVVPLKLPLDHYALEEIRATTPIKRSGIHVSNEGFGRLDI